MSPLNFTLCDYTNEPARKLQEINRICLQPYGLENVFSVADLEDVQAHYSQKGGIFLLVKRGEDILGYGAIDNLYEGVVGALTRLRILPEYQGQGIGSALVKELLKRAQVANY
jgi:GNAT superfamily N-acetyltransferase